MDGKVPADSDFTGIECLKTSGLLLVSCQAKHKLYMIDPISGDAEMFAGFAPGASDGDALTEAKFWLPGGLCVSGDEQMLYIADTGGNRIRCLTL